MTLSIARPLLALAAVLALTACGRDSSEPIDVLAYVPADSPYVIANRIGTPKEVTDNWMNVFGQQNERSYQQLAEGTMPEFLDDDTVGWLRVVLPELGKMSSPEAYESLGLDPAGRFATYGVGLTPVYRGQIADQSRFDAMIARIEAEAGMPLPTRTIGGVAFYQLPASQADALFGSYDGYFVAGLAPPGQSEERWKAQLGLTLPERSMLDSGALAALDSEYGYTGHLSGYVDMLALYDRLVEPGPDRTMHAELGLPVPELDESCTSELRAIVGQFPRAVIGTTSYQAQALEVLATLETDPALAGKLQALAAPLPGASSAAPFRFAIGLRLPATIRLAGTVADSILADTYACDSLQGLNRAAGQAKVQAANPALAMAGSVNAVSLGVIDVQLDDNSKPTAFSGHLSVGSGAPAMLWSLLQQSRPVLASLTLATDGAVVALPDELVPADPLPLQLKARMTASTLGVATRDVEDGTFIAASDPTDTADGTLLRYGINGEALRVVLRFIPEATADMDDKQAQELENARETVAELAEAIRDIEVRIGFGKRGIYYRQTMSLR
jgi:hypothetical protein